ncbi:MAG: wax ester/triacylglycerol synthase family O-acyltransferase [Gammaproteobacteria bacterium]|nr:wax ester/triacylglycerol synthase family O-acyltransferase [Gammaproteobacteria bacterium]
MRQLGIIDSAFINMENPRIPQHVGGVGIYDPSTAPGGVVRFKDVLANFERRLQLLPLFRTRLVEVPLGLDRPYWVLDPQFDVQFHIRHIALPKPGDWRQLCTQVARLHSRALDMSRPLWEAYIIEGLDRIPDLPKGSFAVYTKMHHSLVDGAGGQDFMSVMHDLEPVPPRQCAPSSIRQQVPDLQPTDIRLLGKAALNWVPDLVAKASGGARLASGLARMAMRMARNELPAVQLQGPKTRFDEPVGPNRVFDACVFDLEDLKALKNAANLTLNDIAVCIVSGALRTYLLAHNELPDESLLATMPVNMRTRIGATTDNNQVGAMSARLHTDIADPLERLHTIKKSLDEAKAFIDTPLVNVSKVMGLFSPMISRRLARFYLDHELTRHLPIGVATVITNIMGPPFPVYCAGAQLVQYHPLGLLNPGLGLFHAVFSCTGKVSIGVLADREQMPDPEFYRQCIESAYQELRGALFPAQREPAGTRRRRTTGTARRPARHRAQRSGAKRGKERMARGARDR